MLDQINNSRNQDPKKSISYEPSEETRIPKFLRLPFSTALKEVSERLGGLKKNLTRMQKPVFTKDSGKNPAYWEDVIMIVSWIDLFILAS